MPALLQRRPPAPSRARAAEAAQTDPASLVQVRAEVFAVIPGYRQARARAEDGRQYAITRHTEGIALDALREGQVLMLTVTRSLSRVLRARVVA